MSKILTLLILIAIMATMFVSCDNNKSPEETESLTKISYISDYSSYGDGVAYTVGNSQNYTKRFLDFGSMEQSPLCAVPNCTHSTSSCLSKNIGRFYKPVFYNDYVYFFTSNGGAVREVTDGHEFYINSSLMRASLSSSEIECACEFNDCVPREAGNYVLYGNILYFIGDDRAVTVDELGAYNWSSSGRTMYLCSINLDTNEYTNHGSIYNGDEEYESSKYTRSSNIYGVYDGKMYISHAFVKDQSLDPMSDEYYTYINFELDFETETWKESDLLSSLYMNDNFYSYYDITSKTIKVIYNDKEYEFDLELNLQGFRDSECSELNGKLFFPSLGIWFDLSDSSEHSMGDYAEYDAVGYYDECYILIKSSKTIKLTEEELFTL
ncbi:MAG: hypothetical protein LUD57_01185 [Ruminococcus sp.]|nr:hypothetical protein [Ruminococcus sp.]